MKLVLLACVVFSAVPVFADEPPEPSGLPTFEFRLRALYLSAWGEVEAGETKDTRGERIKAIVPYGHLGLAVDLGADWGWSADLRGSPAALPILLGEPAEARFLALETAIAWRPNEWLSIELGLEGRWHYLKFEGVALDGTPDINRWRLRFVGPSLAISLRF